MTWFKRLDAGTALILHVHFVSAAATDAADRRRRNDEDLGLVDRGDFASQVGDDGVDAPPAAARSFASSNGRNVTAAFGLIVNVDPDSPAIPTEWATPSIPLPISATRLVTTSVRASDAPSGSRMLTITYP